MGGAVDGNKGVCPWKGSNFASVIKTTTLMEKETFTAYDLEKEEARDPACSEIPLKPNLSNPSDKSDESDRSDPAEAEIHRMVAEMGAEKVLEIIKGNRNAAIDQIVKELEDESDFSLQSGTSVANRYSSIFDLAAMA